MPRKEHKVGDIWVPSSNAYARTVTAVDSNTVTYEFTSKGIPRIHAANRISFNAWINNNGAKKKDG